MSTNIEFWTLPTSERLSPNTTKLVNGPPAAGSAIGALKISAAANEKNRTRVNCDIHASITRLLDCRTDCVDQPEHFAKSRGILSPRLRCREANTKGVVSISKPIVAG